MVILLDIKCDIGCPCPDSGVLIMLIQQGLEHTMVIVLHFRAHGQTGNKNLA